MSDSKPTKEKQFTPKEVAARKAELIKFYDEQIPFLKKQIEYEELLTGIEDSRTRRAMARMRYMQIMAPEQVPNAGPPDENPEPDEEMVQSEEGVPKTPIRRTLKTD